MGHKATKHIVVISLCSCVVLFMNITKAVADEKSTLSEGRYYRTLGLTLLPPLSVRKIVGTWFDPDFKVTISIENVNGKLYEVMRSKEGDEGGKWGKGLIESKGYLVIPNSRTGDKYRIMQDGRLGTFDDRGLINVLNRHNKLWP